MYSSTLHGKRLYNLYQASILQTFEKQKKVVRRPFCVCYFWVKICSRNRKVYDAPFKNLHGFSLLSSKATCCQKLPKKLLSLPQGYQRYLEEMTHGGSLLLRKDNVRFCLLCYKLHLSYVRYEGMIREARSPQTYRTCLDMGQSIYECCKG